MNSEAPKKLEKLTADKERFDAILRRMAISKPLPVKDLTGTFPHLPRKPKGKPRTDYPRP
jgi:hypothetical protein